MPAPAPLKAETAKTPDQVIADSSRDTELAERNITALWYTYKPAYGNNWENNFETNKKIKGNNKVKPQLQHNFTRIRVHPSSSLAIQTKLSVNTPGDEFEQEADAVADKIMRMPETATTQVNNNTGNAQQNKADNNKGEQEEEKENEKEQAPVIQKIIQRKYATGGDDGNDNNDDDERPGNKHPGKTTPLITPNVEQVIQSRGLPLDQSTRLFMERRFGFDFSKVQIHNNALAHQSAKDIHALAYTHKNNIVFGEGQYRPQTSDGKKLLAHELMHTLQQSGAIQRSIATIPQPVRNRITLWDTVIVAATLSATALNDYFRTTAPSSSIGFNGTIVIDSSVTTTGSITPFDLTRGLNNIPGLVMASHMPVNSTVTLNMDLSRFGGQNGIFRFTYVNTNTSTAATATPAYEFHIEFVGAVHTAAAQANRPSAITIGSNSFTAAGTWPDDRYNELVEVLGRLPASVQTQINGMRFRYQSQIVQTQAQLGEDGEATVGTGIARTSRQIIVWSSVARPTVVNYGGFSRTAYVVAHEIGHWLDFMPIANAFDAANTAGRAPAATDSLSGYYRMNTSGDFAEGANRSTAFQRLNAANSASTGYGATDLKESFAEYFALYVTEPALLQQIRPAIHRFFSTTFP